MSAPTAKTRRPKGSGGVITGTGKYAGRFRGYRTIAGVRVYTPWLPGKLLASEAAMALQARPVAVVRKVEHTLGEAIAGWMAESRHTPSTRGNNEHKIRTMLAVWTPRPISGITREELSTFYRQTLPDRGYAPSTIHQVSQIVIGGMRHAHDSGWTTANVALRIKLLKVPPQDPQGFSERDRKKILEAAVGTRLEARIRIGILWAMRPAEVCGLRWSDIDFDEGSITVRGQLQRLKQELDGGVLGTLYRDAAKSSAGMRTIWMDEGTLAVLSDWKLMQAAEAAGRVLTPLQVARRKDQARRLASAKKQRLLDEPELYSVAPDDLVFTLANGDPLLARKDADDWKELLIMAGVPHKRLYAMRHTAINHLLANGASIGAVSVIAGHANSSFTEARYGGDRSKLGRGLAALI
jgi:integrase